MYFFRRRILLLLEYTVRVKTDNLVIIFESTFNIPCSFVKTSCIDYSRLGLFYTHLNLTNMAYVVLFNID